MLSYGVARPWASRHGFVSEREDRRSADGRSHRIPSEYHCASAGLRTVLKPVECAADQLGNDPLAVARRCERVTGARKEGDHIPEHS